MLHTYIHSQLQQLTWNVILIGGLDHTLSRIEAINRTFPFSMYEALPGNLLMLYVIQDTHTHTHTQQHARTHAYTHTHTQVRLVKKNTTRKNTTHTHGIHTHTHTHANTQHTHHTHTKPLPTYLQTILSPSGLYLALPVETDKRTFAVLGGTGIETVTFVAKSLGLN